MSTTTVDASSATVTSRAARMTKYQPAVMPVYPVAPGALPLADHADVLPELAGGDQAGQHQLRQRRAAQVGGVLGRHQVRVHPGRGN